MNFVAQRPSAYHHVLMDMPNTSNFSALLRARHRSFSYAFTIITVAAMLPLFTGCARVAHESRYRKQWLFSPSSPCPRQPERGIDLPMSFQGQEQICLYNLERLLDAKQEWAKETCTGPGALSPSPEVLGHRYFRMYKHGRQDPNCDTSQYMPVYQPLCPSGGQYIVGTIGERPKCSQHGDLLRDYDQHIFVPYTH